VGAQLDGARRGAGALGRFGLAQPFDLREQERLPLRRRQRVERRERLGAGRIVAAARRLGRARQIGPRLGWRAIVLRAQSYRLTNQRLLIESGVFSRTINEIDLRTVDDITFHQRFSERVLGLGQIGIVSSEPDPDGARRGAGVRARLVGVSRPREVREQIRNAAYAASGKQVFMRPT